MNRRANLPAGAAALVAAVMAAAPACADDAELERRIEEQQKTIEAQEARIERLERLIEQMLGNAETEAGPAPSRAQTAPSPAPAAQTPASGARPAGKKGASSKDPFAGAAAKVKGYDPERSFFGPLPRFESPEGYSFGFGGLLQVDGAWYGQNGQGDNETTQSLAADLNSGSRFRRAIFAVTGVFPKDWLWAFVYDFADLDDRVIDGLRSAVVIYRGLDPWWILVGQQSNGIGLDASTFSSRRMFMEDAMPAGTFAFAPGSPTMGVSVLYRQNNKFLRVGLLGEPAGNAGNSDEGFGVHARAAWAPVATRTRALHLGVSGYWRKPDVVRGADNVANTPTIRFSSDPEITVDDTSLVDTGRIPRVDDYYHVGLEAALVHGPFSLQGEYGRVGVNRKNGPDEPRFQNLDFDGYYLQTSYFLTGESRNYYPRFAAFWRVKPHREFSLSDGGWGAWELALRYSRVNLDDGVFNLAGGGVRGGVAENYTLGVNWYLNAFVRVLLNYVHSDAENLSDSGLEEGEIIDAVAARLQLEW